MIKQVLQGYVLGKASLNTKHSLEMCTTWKDVVDQLSKFFGESRDIKEVRGSKNDKP